MGKILNWLNLNEPFPPVAQALSEPDGLLACGADLSAERLIEAYKIGIFPWYSDDQPILWWTPSMRMVLKCQDFKISHSLRKKLNKIKNQEIREGLLINQPLTSSIEPKSTIEIRVDTAFAQVIKYCAISRMEHSGTWISSDIEEAYINLHNKGVAHSFETWIDNELVGGLYGVSLGKMFYGESMFSSVMDTSKIALAYAVNFLQSNGVNLIDCQQETSHLKSLGASPIKREDFTLYVQKTVQEKPIKWDSGRLLSNGIIINN